MPQIQVKDANNVTQAIGFYQNTGQAASNLSIPVVVANDQSAITVTAASLTNIDGDIGSPGDAPAVSDIATASIIALQKRGLQTLSSGATAVLQSAQLASLQSSATLQSSQLTSLQAIQTSLVSAANTVLQSAQLVALNQIASSFGGGSTASLQTAQLTSLTSIQTSVANIPVQSGGRTPVATRNTRTTFRDQGVSYTPGTLWTETLKQNGALIFADGNCAGTGYDVISLDPIDPLSAATIEVPLTSNVPIELISGLSMSQRTLGQEFSVELVSQVSDPAPPANLTISSIQQATTTLTITTSTVHNLKVGDMIGIRDVTGDCRLNYSALVVNTTPSTTQFTATTGPGGAIPSITVGPFAQGSVYRRLGMNGNLNGTCIVFENATATNATFHVRGGEANVFPSGTINANQSVTIGTTASVQAVNAALNYGFQPTNEFRLVSEPHRIQWFDTTVDAVTSPNLRLTRTQVCPDPSLAYRIRVRALNYPSITRPVAQIVSVVKSGTTTATITTDVAHGLTITDLIQAYGTRDQTNFANLTAATSITSIVNSTQFTVTWGSAVTATTYGGFVNRVNGGQLLQGVVTMVGQSISRTSNIVTFVGNASWSGMLIGDLVNIIGVRDNTTGASLGLDGSYRVRDIQTTSLFLEPVGSAPTGSDVASTNCGGGLIKRTDLRLHYVKSFEFERERVEFTAKASNDTFASAPVIITNTPSTTATISSGTVTTVSTVTSVTSGNFGIPGIITDVASAALSSTTTTSAFTPTFGSTYEINIPVTVVSGTSPTMDVGIEESDDSGTNWFRVYDFPRITATGMYRSPKLPLTGNRVRYVQTVGGSGPSFTRAINRMQNSDNADSVRQIIDRTIVLTTLNSVTPSLTVQNCRSMQIVVNIGAATTAPILQLEGSDDLGSTWYAIGTTLTSVASSTVQLTVANIQTGLLRARVSTAGSGVTLGFVLIKGF